MTSQYKIRAHGRVQGVGFRYTLQKEARSLGLRGWVKNLPDGTVESIIQGPEPECHRFISWCRRGPGYSWVEKLEVEEQEPGDLSGFRIIR